MGNSTDPYNSLSDTAATTEAGGLGSLFTGLLGDAASKYIDSKFPTGNTTAQNAQAQIDAAKATANAQVAVAQDNTKMLLIGGGVAAGVVLVAFLLLKK